MLGANVMWGLMAPIAKMVMAAGIIGPLLMTDFRITGAAVMFWIYSLFCKKEHVPAPDLLRLLGAALIGIVFNQGCYIFGVSHTAPGEAAVIATTMPLWVLLLSAVVLKERITGRKITGIVLGGCGALILVLGNLGNTGGGDNNIKGDLLVLTAQLSYACYLTLYKNFIKNPGGRARWRTSPSCGRTPRRSPSLRRQSQTSGPCRTSARGNPCSAGSRRSPFGRDIDSRSG